MDNANPAGTLNYLKEFSKRKGKQIESGNLEEPSTNHELTVKDITTLDQATTFIKENFEKLVYSWFNLAHALKKVHDEELYREKFGSFQEYYDSELGYKKRMVYYFLKIAETYSLDTSEDVLQLGVKKMLLLGELPEEERENYMQNNDLAGMSSSEIKEDLKKIKSTKKEKKESEAGKKTEPNNNESDEQGTLLDEKNISHTDAGLQDQNLSISSQELQIVNEFYFIIKNLFGSVENFKSEQMAYKPVNKAILEEMENSISGFEGNIEQIKSIIAKYKN